jgi:hypothetical protein
MDLTVSRRKTLLSRILHLSRIFHLYEFTTNISVVKIRKAGVLMTPLNQVRYALKEAELEIFARPFLYVLKYVLEFSYGLSDLFCHLLVPD